MTDIDELLTENLQRLPPKPSDSAPRETKKSYSEAMSNAIATAFAQALRNRNLKGTLPAPREDPKLKGGKLTKTGTERRMAGGLGASLVFLDQIDKFQRQ
jgi:hypothetical protein